jgi:hypothetical protein
MDPEYTVMGRGRGDLAVAMRTATAPTIAAEARRDPRPPLHAQEVQFNDIRTRLQALIAIYDNCNSLHTNAFDEAITTPTEDRCAGRWRSS